MTETPVPGGLIEVQFDSCAVCGAAIDHSASYKPHLHDRDDCIITAEQCDRCWTFYLPMLDARYDDPATP